MMRKSLALVYFGLIIVVSGSTIGGSMIFAFSAHSDINKESNTLKLSAPEDSIIDLIDQLIEDVQNSPNSWWRKPANGRRNAMIKKLIALKGLVSSNNLDEAYDKLLYDIKPKLTGKKEDENGVTWGKGTFRRPWIILPYRQRLFGYDCDDILTLIKNFNQPQ